MGTCIARSLRAPLSRVYGVATFYNFFKMKPAGEHTCTVCMGTACYVKGAGAILEALEAEHGIKAGETTPDQKLSLVTARCVGACGLAPAVVIDDDLELLVDVACLFLDEFPKKISEAREAVAGKNPAMKDKAIDTTRAAIAIVRIGFRKAIEPVQVKGSIISSLPSRYPDTGVQIDIADIRYQLCHKNDDH